MIRGVYRLPFCRHSFIVVSSLEGFSDNSKQLKRNKKRMEYFGHILQSRDHKCPKLTLQWTHKLVSENDFLSVIQTHIPKELESSNQSFDNPVNLELLAINLVKIPDNPVDPSYSTPKVLSCVSNGDVIEVFI